MAKQFQWNKLSGGSLTTSLVSYYKLNDGNDFYGSNNFTTSNMSFGSGKVIAANGAIFNGTSSYMIQSAPNFGSAYSIAFWMNINFNNTSEATQRIFIDTTAGGSPNRPFLFYYEPSYSPKQFGWDSGGANVIDPFTYSFGNISGQWHFWVFNWSTTTNWNVYFDNSSIQSGSATITTGQPTNLTLGIRTNLGGGQCPMTMSELGFWNKSLSANEMTDLYYGGVGQTMINSGNMFSVL